MHLPATIHSSHAHLNSRSGATALFSVLLLAFLALTQSPPARAGAAIYVTTVQQGVTDGSNCSLQEAIYSAEFKTNKAIVSTDPDTYYTTGCVPGTGAGDIIVLPANATFSFTQFWDGDEHNIYGPTVTPVIFTSMTIEANGSTLQWTGTGNARLFAIGTVNVTGFGAGTGSLTLRNAYVKGFRVKGGDGGRSGGGGGLGAGGAIFVGLGSGLTVQNSTFALNSAVGGNGGGFGPMIGGGGGLNGNGGSDTGAGGGAGDTGGGGGGARGNGGSVIYSDPCCDFGGGGGGGTVASGADGTHTAAGPGGYLCGGGGGAPTGGDAGNAKCDGGGGGGGGAVSSFGSFGNGGNGAFGGGGGGGGQGGVGGFGGGGGGGVGNITATGGNGGFGGGGGAGNTGVASTTHGKGGPFGGNANGNASNGGGGGGGALGGAIFSYRGNVTIQNSTFNQNSVARGLGGGHGAPGAAANGGDAGGAIFAIGGNLSITDSTISGNAATGSGGGVVIYDIAGPGGQKTGTFKLYNSIISTNGANECYAIGTGGTLSGTGNLIMSNNSLSGRSPCPGQVASADPQLGLLQKNQGYTPTMALAGTSPAINIADAGTSILKDQRGQDRPAMGGYDIGAFEYCVVGRPPLVPTPCPISGGVQVTTPLTMAASPAADGVISPVAGVYNEPLGSVVLISAIGKAGFTFTHWTGAVTDSLNPFTSAVIGNNPVSATANFVACTCAHNVRGSVSVTRSAIVYNATTTRYVQTVTVKNVSAAAITGPISLVFDGLTPGVTIAGPAGTTDSQELPAGSPYLNSAGNLAAGASHAFKVEFVNLTKVKINYTPRVLAGPGAR